MGPVLDTVHMSTEHLTPEDYVTITQQLQARYGVSPSGDVAYTHYVATIAAPSTGAPIRFQVRTAKWIKRPGERQPYKVDGINSLSIEASIHKAMHGHNVYGGAIEPQDAIQWLVNLSSLILDLELPSLDHWFVSRLDVAESFDLDSLDNVRGWIRAKSLVVYPRRSVEFFSDLGFRAPGATTTVKAYAKGPQFRSEGGFKALITCRGLDYAHMIARQAEKTLRCEVEIKSPIWDKLPHKGRASDITQDYLESTYDAEWRKLLRPLDSDSRIAHTAVEVFSRLQATYSDGTKCFNLYLVWCVLAIRGEGWYRTQVAASTWRKQRASLESAYISWESTNILTIDCPDSLQRFAPILSAVQRMREVLPLGA